MNLLRNNSIMLNIPITTNMKLDDPAVNNANPVVIPAIAPKIILYFIFLTAMLQHRNRMS